MWPCILLFVSLFLFFSVALTVIIMIPIFTRVEAWGLELLQQSHLGHSPFHEMALKGFYEGAPLTPITIVATATARGNGLRYHYHGYVVAVIRSL